LNEKAFFVKVSVSKKVLKQEHKKENDVATCSLHKLQSKILIKLCQSLDFTGEFQ